MRRSPNWRGFCLGSGSLQKGCSKLRSRARCQIAMDSLAEATRPIMWNVPFSWAIYPLFIIALISLGYGLYGHIARWRRGADDMERLTDYSERFWFTIKEILAQTRIRRASIAGIFHSLFFYSFIVFVITTAVIALASPTAG